MNPIERACIDPNWNTLYSGCIDFRTLRNKMKFVHYNADETDRAYHTLYEHVGNCETCTTNLVAARLLK